MAVVALWSAGATEIGVESLSRNGVLTWTNASLNVTCRVEWAASAEGPWHGSWESLTNIVITNHVTTRPVPMFYRVVCSPGIPWQTNVSAAQALTLVQARSTDPAFVILDVRTPSEYQPSHIKSAINVDFYSAGFQDSLGALDRNRSYLVYCASGNRSRQATTIMQGMGFMQIYSMSQGFSTFAAQPGAGTYLEP